MPASQSRWARTVVTASAVAAVVVSGLATSSPAGAATAQKSGQTYKSGQYVVLLNAPPAAGYAGGVSGLAPSRARPGKKFNARSSAAKAYRSYLRSRQSRLAKRFDVRRISSYTVVNNGFAAHLSGKQATALAKAPGVRAVVKDRLRKPDTTESPAFLGLSGPEGVWASLGGPDNAGKGIVVGVVDTGYWPENPSFAGTALPRGEYVSERSPGPIRNGKNTAFYKADGQRFHGRCASGEQFSPTLCNSKVIGARYFVQGFAAAVRHKDWSAAEFRSPRDGAGHGSHTASTAVGNDGVDVTIEGRDFGQASGMAPGAKLAVYKACWEAADPDQSGCFDSDTVAAIDRAAADGVDVINFSVSGTLDDPIDPVEVSFLFAAAAGIFVATSAGNEGPGDSTVAHPSPWVTTVAASTHFPREGTVILSTGQKIKGASVTVTDPVTGTLVSSAASGLPGASDPALCAPGSLDPAKVTGMIVQCDRGVYDRVAKSAEVKRAGGIGMVLTNTSPNSLDADFHSVPTVHVADTDRAAVLADVGKTVTLVDGNQTGIPTPVPQVAEFSSRGPSLAADGDLLKPDISAPGVSVVAAVAPPSNSGRDWDLYSGTSMASPHIAGLAALYLGVHPTWSPMWVKSAMMTTAYDTKNADGSAYQNPFGQGAGHVDPTQFLDPGIVFDSGFFDWLDFLAGQGVTDSTGAPVGDPIDASDLNLPSLAIGDLGGVQSVTRTITNVTDTEETYTPLYKGDDSIAVTFDKGSYTVPAGGSATMHVTVTATGTDLGDYATGFITLTGTSHAARIPVAVRPLAVAADAEVTGPAGSGSIKITGIAGFSGTLGTAVTGLTGATPTATSVTSGAFDPNAPAASPAVKEFTLVVPAGTDLARFDVDAASDGDDLDLYVYEVVDGAKEPVALSATGSGDEQVSLEGPEAGTYVAYVVGFATPGGGKFAYTQWAVPSADAGNLTVVPATQPVETGKPFSLTATYSGLDPAQRYLGRVHYLNGTEDTGIATVVSVG